MKESKNFVIKNKKPIAVGLGTIALIGGGYLYMQPTVAPKVAEPAQEEVKKSNVRKMAAAITVAALTGAAYHSPLVRIAAKPFLTKVVSPLYTKASTKASDLYTKARNLFKRKPEAPYSLGGINLAEEQRMAEICKQLKIHFNNSWTIGGPSKIASENAHKAGKIRLANVQKELATQEANFKANLGLTK